MYSTMQSHKLLDGNFSDVFLAQGLLRKRFVIFVERKQKCSFIRRLIYIHTRWPPYGLQNIILFLITLEEIKIEK